MLREKIFEELKLAMKMRDKVRLAAVRYVLALVKNAEIDAKRELEDSEVVKIVSGEVKKRKEAIEMMKGREDLVAEEEAKVKVLEEFLPEQMGEGEISKVVDQVIGESGERDFGKVMKLVMQQVAGRAGGKLVSEVVRRKLQVS
ncbi:MAG: hypothetical protein A2784_02280 [Candidatus Chisholmbacteria bacterium RIFCSPHIGHO2_01_FULL_48_12]|uniref:Glutamyl-tRNA amidotransferase n=1 Tax=Candidatus Chisholmbacteria bacterium RIFCSPHIGHO2_01_FULL_48_12 TaxID=1797589 RepID=A0A1G1VMU7_9BACT|nr:MAG: hypothetical protein A2784_02280 [Candidatus Chisholmbacteria bacterium RIFCSPHIGHO2_01_FULL_48_12]